MASRTLPAIDLAAFADEHLRYEAWMYVEARDGLRPTSQFEVNVRIEVCLFHLRNLIDFFYLSNPRPDDVVAADYLANWENDRPPFSVALDAARERANKELAHLTTKRKAGTPPDKAWDFPSLSADMRVVVNKFLSLSPSNIPANTATALKRI